LFTKAEEKNKPLLFSDHSLTTEVNSLRMPSSNENALCDIFFAVSQHSNVFECIMFQSFSKNKLCTAFLTGYSVAREGLMRVLYDRWKGHDITVLFTEDRWE
jgi:hypothetical protein